MKELDRLEVLSKSVRSKYYAHYYMDLKYRKLGENVGKAAREYDELRDELSDLEKRLDVTNNGP